MKVAFCFVLILSMTSACVTGPSSNQSSTMDSEMLFKILTPEEWHQFQQDKVFKGSPLDLKDGFIHIAFAEQYPQILAKFFKDRRPVILLKIDAKLLKPGALKVESNKPGGEKFPHIYGEIPFAAVISHEVLDK